MSGTAAALTAQLARSRRTAVFEVAVAAAALAAAVAVAVVTLHAHFLQYPGWLTVQKVDLIVGPIGVGLYWRHQRPRSRFGSMLVALGVVNAVYIAQSSSDSAVFTLGVEWESVNYVATLAIILAFPSGRLRRTDLALVAASVLCVAVPNSSVAFFAPQISAVGALGACRAACPANALFVSSNATALRLLIDADRIGIILIDLAAVCLLVYRIASGTPPQRRALAIGTPVALLFLVSQSSYQLNLLSGGFAGDLSYVRWSVPIARSAVWYGFLAALIAAQLVAGRVLRSVLAATMRRPSLPDLAALLRRPLGDPRLELAFWDGGMQQWVGDTGSPVAAPGVGRELTMVERDGRPAAAIIHDAQLSDDPELVQAAGATASLVYENAELHAAWTRAMREVRESRSRIAAVSARERRSLEQDLHDGAQGALVALRIKLALATDDAVGDPALGRRLGELGDQLDDAIRELRDIAQGIYPTLLAEFGLPTALRAVAQRAAAQVTVSDDGVGRYSPEVESAAYYCCREAIQNVVRHAGSGVHTTIRLSTRGGELSFEVEDDGCGFDTTSADGGAGLQNMHDRVEALDGSITIVSSHGGGTRVMGALPLRG
jgi:signal transduction histidine kinase